MIAQMSTELLVLKHMRRCSCCGDARHNYGLRRGGLHKKALPIRRHIIVQVASGRFGVHPAYLKAGPPLRFKIGQGAKPGLGSLTGN